MAGRLATILEKEYKTKGFVSGLTSAGSKRIREIFDIRNLLFSGSGITSLLGRKIFGKGYSATTEIDKKIKPTGDIINQESVALLSSIKKDTSISAKNSIVLPQMARDMNLTKQNIMKIVKLQGGTASMKADMFFKRAAQRESEYESRLGRFPFTSPESVNKPSNGILSGIFLAISTLLRSITPFFSKMIEYLFKILMFLTAGKIAGIPGLGGRPTPGGGPVPGPGAPRGPVPVPTPNLPPSDFPSPGSGGSPGGTPPRTPGTILGPDGKPLPPSKPTETQKKTLIEKLKKVLSSPKAKAKFMTLAAKTAIGRFIPALVVSGPLAPIVLAMLSVMSFYEIMQIINESLKDDEKTQNFSPTNINEQQNDMANLIYNRFKEAGFSDVQAKAAVANAIRESSLNPNAHVTTEKEDSVGLFQLNRKGGVGTGYTVEQLKDPEFNIQVAINAAKTETVKGKDKTAKSFSQSTTIEDATTALVRDVLRPANLSDEIQKRIEIAKSDKLPGEKINMASVNVTDENRRLAAAVPSPIINQDNRVVNNQTGNMAHGAPNPFAYDKELVQLLLGQTT